MQTRNPTFNETFEFDLSKYLDNDSKNLNKFGINLVVLDWNPIEKCEILGELVLCNRNEIWNSIFEIENEVVVASYKLSNSKK